MAGSAVVGGGFWASATHGQETATARTESRQSSCEKRGLTKLCVPKIALLTDYAKQVRFGSQTRLYTQRAKVRMAKTESVVLVLPDKYPALL